MSTSSDLEAEVVRLRARVACLEGELDVMKKTCPQRERIQQMSAEVVDTNPYRYHCQITDLLLTNQEP